MGDKPADKELKSDDDESGDDGELDADALNQENQIIEWNEDEAEAVDYDARDEEEEDGNYSGAIGSNGEREGQGTCKYPDNSVYTGEWKNNKREGKGTYQDKDGARYEGEWLEDKKDGEGKLFKPKGQIVEAYWVNDRIHGKGTLTKNGKTKEYVWHHDMKIDQASQDAYCDRAWLNILIFSCIIVAPVLFIVTKNGAAFGLILLLCICNCIEA